MNSVATNWSVYQQACIRDAAEGAGHTVIEALAGAGKSSTQEEMICHVPRGMCVLVTCFNTEIKNAFKEREARILKRRPDFGDRGLEIKTVCGLGYAVCRYAFKGIRVDEFKAHDQAREIIPGDEHKAYRSMLVKVAGLAKGFLVDNMRDALNLCASRGDLEMALVRSGFDPERTTEEQEEHALETMARDLLALLHVAKSDVSRVDFDDMWWIPLVMNLRGWGYDRIFCDEFQDLNYAQFQLLRKMCKRGGRICLVGDQNQCHPPGVMIQVAPGVSVPIESLADGDRVAGWNRQAQKMVHGRPVRVARRPYDGNIIDMMANGRTVPMTPNHRVLCRWTDRNVNTCVTYLMWRRDFGFRVGWCKLFANIGGAKTLHLATRTRLEKADKVWILKTHESRTGASVYESIVAAKYGIPTATFEPVDNAAHQTSDAIREIFDAVADHNDERGQRALEDHDLEFGLHLYPWPGMAVDAPQGRRTYFEVYANNLLPGLMSVPLPDATNAWTKIDGAPRRRYTGSVYSLDVAEDHSYAANGVVVLNCIYAFRGGSVDMMQIAAEELRAKVLPLHVTYRCDKAIVDVARDIVPEFTARPGAGDGLVEGVTSKDYEDVYQLARPGEFVISRKNAPLLSLCIGFLKRGIPAIIRGKKDVAATFLQLIERSKAKTLDKLFAWVDKWEQREIKRLTRKNPEADTSIASDTAEAIRVLASDVDEVSEIRAKIELLFTDDDDSRRVVLTSTHKAKGLERGRVVVLADTYRPGWGGEEARLWYVAVTRAKHELYLARNEVQKDE